MARNLPFDEQVRVRAYEIFLERGGAGGSPEEDWARAEAEVRQREQADGPGRAAVSAADGAARASAPEDPLADAETKPGEQQDAQQNGQSAGSNAKAASGRAGRNVKSPAANRRSH